MRTDSSNEKAARHNGRVVSGTTNDRGAMRTTNIVHLDIDNRRRSNSGLNFVPVFKDCESDIIFSSNFADGRRAPFHCLDGLPDNAFSDIEAPTLQQHVIAGFMHGGTFYTREEAAARLKSLDDL